MYCCYRTTSKEQNSSWEAVAASRLLLNPKVHYFAHISPLLVLILSQMNPVRYVQIHFNGTLPFTPQSSACALSVRFLNGNLCVFLISVTRPSPHPLSMWSPSRYSVHIVLQVMNHIIVYLPAASRESTSAWAQYSPEHPVHNSLQGTPRRPASRM